jgi:hypothetical protein
VTRKFYYHPDRRKEVGDAVITGHLVVPSVEHLVEDALMPLTGSTGYQILGFWVDCMEPKDFFLIPPQPNTDLFEFTRKLGLYAQSLSGA